MMQLSRRSKGAARQALADRQCPAWCLKDRRTAGFHTSAPRLPTVDLSDSMTCVSRNGRLNDHATNGCQHCRDAGWVRLLHRAAAFIWAAVDAEGPWSPRQVLSMSIDLPADEVRNLLPDAIRGGHRPLEDKAARWQQNPLPAIRAPEHEVATRPKPQWRF
jgi:hypothetical protein